MDNTINNVDTKYDVKKLSADEKVADNVTGHQEIKEDALTSNESISPKHGGQDTEKSTKEDSKKVENICISKDDLLQSNSILLAKIDSLSRLFSEKIRHSEHEEKIVTQMHTELQKYKGDMYAQLIRPVLLDIIEMRDSILRIASTYLKKPEGEQDIPNKTFEGYAFDIQDILEKNGVEIYKSRPEDDFVPVKQRVIKKTVTGNKELHGKIAESLSCGYNYNGRTISAEKIAIYYYEEPVEIIQENDREEIKNG
jgi:molecular chaperone GrpE (heat shock protein)